MVRVIVSSVVASIQCTSSPKFVAPVHGAHDPTIGRGVQLEMKRIRSELADRSHDDVPLISARDAVGADLASASPPSLMAY
jgi:hypothetical protein